MLKLLFLSLPITAASEAQLHLQGPPLEAMTTGLSQIFHANSATDHSQDASGVYYDPSTELYHVMPDCTGGYAPDGGLSWCHLTSSDLIHWEEEELVLFPTIDKTIDPCQPTVVDTGSVSLLPNGDAFLIYSTANQTSASYMYVASEPKQRIPGAY